MRARLAFALALPLFVLASALTSQGGSSLTVSVVDHGCAGRTDTVEVEAEDKEGTTARASVSPGSEVALDLPHGGAWQVRARAPGCWSARRSANAPGKLALDLHPSATVAGSVSTERGIELPAAIRIRHTGVGGDTPNDGEETCPISSDGTFSCALPAGSFDLRFRVTGFISHFFWAKRLEPEKRNHFGQLELEPGSSVVGWVEREDRQPLDDTVSVALQPEQAGTDATARALAEAMGLVLKPDPSGFFHFVGVTPGRYRLVATLTGFSSATAAGVEVFEGFEGKLSRPLILTRPHSAAFQMWPPRSPTDHVWQVRLFHQRREGLEFAGLENCDEQGFVVFEGLPGGTFNYVIADSETSKGFHEGSLELSSTDTFLPIELNLVPFDGEARLGREPLENAQLVFGGETSPVGVTVTTGEGGHFSGTVPSEGTWKVEIRADTPSIRRTLRRVEVVPGRDGRAWVEITLPDNTVRGKVVDENRRPQARALVTARPQGVRDGVFTVWTDEDGMFDVVGLPAGLIALAAETQAGAESDLVAVQVHDGSETPEVELVARERRTLKGVVRSRLGPYPGARVYVREWGVALRRGDEAVSDALGRFELELPASATTVHVQVLAPGQPFYLRRHELGDGDLLITLAEHASGPVEVKYSINEYEWVYASRSGATAWYGPLRLWASLHSPEGAVSDERLVIPRLSPGTWSFCRAEPGSATWLSVHGFGLAASKQCETVELGPFGTATIDLNALPGEVDSTGTRK